MSFYYKQAGYLDRLVNLWRRQDSLHDFVGQAGNLRPPAGGYEPSLFFLLKINWNALISNKLPSLVGC
ncbi:MAG: hypothetical protein WBO31_11955 [Saprospiraceae bacterium]